jgi:methylated-DNA-[protein]-cysteine S-methyltransferase
MTTTLDAIGRACTAQASIATPLGPLLLARTPAGLAGAWFEGQRHHPPALAAPKHPDDLLLARAAACIGRYFAGALDAFDGLAFDLRGSPFQRAVWEQLLAIPRGATRSYADIARAVGRPAAVRAVGAAVGRNPLSILVPCHRVVGSDGTLTGYAGGIERKAALLALEGARMRNGSSGRGLSSTLLAAA